MKELITWRNRVQPTMGLFYRGIGQLAGLSRAVRVDGEGRYSRKCFLASRSSSAESLEECGKTQNQKRDLADSVATLQRAGLEVMGGFIIGFDSDPRDIFARQFEFIQRTGVATAMVGLLTALPETALYRRLADEGRILTETCGNNTDAVLNFVTRMDLN